MTKNSYCVVLGVTGGIAAYKALDIISALKKKDIEVNVIMTRSAKEFVSPLTFQTLSQNIVVSDMFEEPKAFEIQHISLAKKADIILVAPATANIIGKVANGIADDMLSTTIMATKAKVVFALAMNTNMYNNKIVQENISKLKSYGYEFIEPTSGRLACGDDGKGKLADTKYIADKVESMLYNPKDLEGKTVLVTAGPTIANIDPVRYITNKSTGKMGYAIAKEARDRGAEVILISGPTNLEKPFEVEFISVNTNEEMLKEVLWHYEKADIVVKTAAVSDYKPRYYSEEKIKKSEESISIELLKDKDILKTLGEKKQNQILVGFAAESSNLIENAKNKLIKKNLDYIVANDILHTGFALEDNEVSIICKDGDVIKLESMNKKKVAKELFDIVNKRR